MSDWIDQAYEQEQQEQKTREHYWEVFPALADSIWTCLQVLIKKDVEKLRSKFSYLSSLHVYSSRDLEIRKMEYPGYYVRFICNVKGQQIIVEQEHVPNAQSRHFREQKLFTLSLDSAHQNVLIALEGKQMTLEEVSEYCLRPLIKK
jgi:hypothetical protein